MVPVLLLIYLLSNVKAQSIRTQSPSTEHGRRGGISSIMLDVKRWKYLGGVGMHNARSDRGPDGYNKTRGPFVGTMT